jgi:uncharacterized membrane protein YqjE
MMGNGRYQGTTPNVAQSVSDLTHDVIELTELQSQLFALDVKQSTEKARTTLILAVVGVCVLLGTIPVALLALAAILMYLFEWSAAAANSVAALVGLVIAGGILGVAYSYVKKGLVSMERSRDELKRNVAWLKSSLRDRGRAHTRPPEETPIKY